MKLKTPQGFRYRKRSDGLYVALMAWGWVSERYGKKVVIREGTVRDGATGAWDIVSLSWWIHDQLCADGHWADGSDVSPWQAASVLGDILRAEGRWARATYWKWATYLLGCKKSRGDHSRD